MVAPGNQPGPNLGCRPEDKVKIMVGKTAGLKERWDSDIRAHPGQGGQREHSQHLARSCRGDLRSACQVLNDTAPACTHTLILRGLKAPQVSSHAW